MKAAEKRSDLIERAEKCVKEDHGTLSNNMIEELIEEIVRLNGTLVEIREAYAGANRDRLRLYKWKDAHGDEIKIPGESNREDED